MIILTIRISKMIEGLMKVTSILTTILLFSVLNLHAQKVKKADPEKLRISSSLDTQYEAYKNIANQIWNFSEVGFKEVKSSALLQKTLADAGFVVEAGVAGMPTAFVATWGNPVQRLEY